MIFIFRPMVKEKKIAKNSSKKVNLTVKVKKPTKKKKSVRTAKGRAEAKPKKLKKIIEKPKIALTQKEAINPGTARIISEKEEASKQLIMWAGVTFFMIIIGLGWIYNTKQVFKETKLVGQESGDSRDFKSLTDDISQKMDEIGESLKEINNYIEEEPISTSSDRNIIQGLPETASSTNHATTSEKLSDEQLEELIEKLQ